ncbi:Transmembrane protein 62 [Tritrichomonas musculus]|uniref:Transmembrane protein 62 n=1 Tax=Tritrichomonas musculus TaxID=1915356 RepID=A0ABR2JWM6_9EUKA
MFHWISYLFSQYLWVSIFAVLLSFPFFLSYTQHVEINNSRKPEKPFNSSLIPDYFVHLTDVHINHKYEQRSVVFNTVLNHIESINPMLSFFTGDLADDFTKSKHPNYAVQQPEDHEIYYNLTNHYDRSSKLFETAGNHDEYGVYSFNSQGHHYQRFHKESENSFYLKVVNYTLRDNRRVHFFIMNPFKYPSAHAPLLFWPSPLKKFLNQIEDAIDSIPQDDRIVFLNHYPVNLFLCLQKSKKGRNFKEIARKVADFAISGHNHPKFPIFQHQGRNLLEVVGSDLVTHKRMNLFTFDNDRFVYHYLNYSKKPKFLFVTNPVPTEQLTEGQIFNELKTPIRCIVFTEHIWPVLTVSGDVNSEMTCINVTDQKGGFIENCEKPLDMFLCSADQNLNAGSYTIQISGTYNTSLNFTLGEKVPKFQENVYSHSKIAQFPVSFVIVFILALIVFTPIPRCSRKIHDNNETSSLNDNLVNENDHEFSVSKYNEWLQGAENGKRTTDFLFASILGFIAVRNRISRLPLYLRSVLFFFVVFVLFGPISFMEIEGHLSAIWWFGYLSGGKAVYALWGQLYATYYIVLSIGPVMLIASTLSMNRFHLILIVDVLVAIFCACVTGFIIYRYLSESVNMTYSLLSPGFIIIPIILYCWLIFYAIKKWCKKEYQNHNVLNVNHKSLL